MRRLPLALTLLATAASPAAAQGSALMTPNPGLMVWTLVIFVALFLVLKRFAFPPILAAVEARERALEEAIEGAKRDREEAARILAQHRAELEGARAEAQRFIAEGRAAAEKMRTDMLAQTRVQQQELMDRALRDIEAERDRAIADLRREAIDLALAGASKVIERNLDDTSNRRLVETFLASLDTPSGADGARR